MTKICLWHPESPGVKVLVREPSLLRRLGIVRSEFATLGEVCKDSTSYVMLQGAKYEIGKTY